MGITETARQRILYDQNYEAKYKNPDAMLSYIEDGGNFRTLASLIKDTMIKSGVCSSDADDGEFKRTLTDLLFQAENESDSSVSKDSVRKRVARWIDGNVKSIERVESAMEICFALNLSLDETNEFLNKAGFCSLNIRKVEDAIYFYCFLQNDNGNKKTFADAQNLIRRFYTEESDDVITDDEEIMNNPNGTTVYLMDALYNANWETDDDFLISYMLRNKCRFLGYSKHALFEYHKVKNILFVTSLLFRARNAEGDYVESAVRAALGKVEIGGDADPADVFLDQINEAEAYDVLLKVKEYIFNLPYAPESIKSQIAISRFLLNVSSPKDLYKTTLKVLVNNGEMHSFKSFLEIRGNLVNEEALASSEMNPFLSADRNKADTNRKMLILFLYLLFSFDIYRKKNESGKKAEADNLSLFDDLSFMGFVNSANKALEMSSFGPIYLPNKFDCFIVMSVRNAEIAASYGECVESPFEFTNEVFRLILSEVVRSWRAGSLETVVDDEWVNVDTLDGSLKEKLNQLLDEWQSDFWSVAE